VEAGDFAHFAAAVGAGQEFDGVARGSSYVAGFDQISIHAVLDDFGDAADVGSDDGDFASHSFKGGEAERFELRGEKEKIGGGEFFVNIVLLAEEVDVFLQAIFADEEFGGAAVWAVADEDEFCWHRAANDGENLDDVGEALDGTKI
jgi:hypothetical protein